jgi:hypothetical protein
MQLKAASTLMAAFVLAQTCAGAAMASVIPTNPTLEISATPGVGTHFSFQTFSAASCVLLDGERRQPIVHADALGVVRLDIVLAKDDAAQHTVTFRCSDRVSTIDVPVRFTPRAGAPVDQAAPADVTPLMTLARYRGAPTGFDPRTASQDQLMRYGFPPRPQAPSKKIDSWLRFVTMPHHFALEPPVSAPEIRHGPPPPNAPFSGSISYTWASNWTGYQMFEAVGLDKWYESIGQWYVPSVSLPNLPPYDGCYASGYSSTWAGMGGLGTDNGLVQSGTEQDALWTGKGQCQGGGGCGAVRPGSPRVVGDDCPVGYGKPNPASQPYMINDYAWFEFLPAPEVKYGLPIHTGDFIEAWNWAKYVNNTTASFCVYDATENQTNCSTEQEPYWDWPDGNDCNGTCYDPTTVEWIYEATTVDNTIYPLPTFSQFEYVLGAALDSEAYYLYPVGSTASYQYIYMIQNGAIVAYPEQFGPSAPDGFEVYP